jgi:hypothetical protein
MAKKSEQVDVEIIEIKRGEVRVCMVGSSPLILHRLSEKARRELLMPKGKKTAADKASNLKHDPMREFRDSAHLLNAPAKTLLGIPTTAFKGAMMTAALDMPGLKKTEVGRRIFVKDQYVEVYGIPKLHMCAVRMADMARTPDIRTRVIVPEWAAVISVCYASPIVKQADVVNLIAAAGFVAGVGDFRSEKGKGAYGQFELTGETDARFKRIVKEGARAAQVEAMTNPEPYDEDTRELFDWFMAESAKRGWKVEAPGTALDRVGVTA